MAETKAAMAALNLNHNEISVSLGFQVCMIYEDELNSKISSIMKGINFMLGMGLGRDQQGPLEFIKPKVSISKYVLGYQKTGKSRRSKAKAKKKMIW